MKITIDVFGKITIATCDLILVLSHDYWGSCIYIDDRVYKSGGAIVLTAADVTHTQSRFNSLCNGSRVVMGLTELEYEKSMFIGYKSYAWYNLVNEHLIRIIYEFMDELW